MSAMFMVECSLVSEGISGSEVGFEKVVTTEGWALGVGLPLLGRIIDDFEVGSVWRTGTTDFVVFWPVSEDLVRVFEAEDTGTNGARPLGLGNELFMIALNLNFVFKRGSVGSQISNFKF